MNSYQREVLDHPLIKRIRQMEKKQVMDFIQKNLNRNQNVLEIGCGNGFYTKELEKWFAGVEAMDKDPLIIKDQNGLDLKQGDLFQLDLDTLPETNGLILLGVMEFFNAEQIEKCFVNIFPQFDWVLVMTASTGLRSWPYRLIHQFKNGIRLNRIYGKRFKEIFECTHSRVLPFNDLFLLKAAHKD